MSSERLEFNINHEGFFEGIVGELEKFPDYIIEEGVDDDEEITTIILVYENEENQRREISIEDMAEMDRNNTIVPRNAN